MGRYRGVYQNYLTINDFFIFTLYLTVGGPVASNMHPVMAAFLELMNDAYLRFVIFGLSAVLQTITTDCPTALVWHYFGENKSPSSLLGSPLDYLPRLVFSYYLIINYNLKGNKNEGPKIGR